MNKIRTILFLIIVFCFYDLCEAKFKYFKSISQIKFSNETKSEAKFNIGNIRFSKDNKFMYCNFPRESNIIKATLVRRNIEENENEEIYEPYPDLAINDYKGGCGNLFSVISFEIDEEDNLYILDKGKKINNRYECLPKIIIKYKNENKTEIHEFKDNNVNNKYLEDILVDRINKYIYITYHDKNANGIFLMKYNLNNTNVKILLYNNSKLENEIGYSLSIKDYEELLKEKKNTKSIGLSCDGTAFFFSLISSKMIYSILTKDIYYQYNNDENKIIDLQNIPINEAYKNDATSAIIYSNMGNLLFTSLEKRKIYSYDLIDNDLSRFDYKGLRELNSSEIDIMFPLKMTINEGRLYLLTNQSKTNDTRNYSIYLDDDIGQEKSYIYGCAGLKYQFNLSFYIMLSIFFIILLFVLTFVIVGNIQDKDINKKNN